MSKACASNLASDQWNCEPLIPAKPAVGLAKSKFGTSQRHTFYLLSEGCRWRSLLGDFPAANSLHRTAAGASTGHG